jgi:hypothetical protein
MQLNAMAKKEELLLKIEEKIIIQICEDRLHQELGGCHRPAGVASTKAS